MDQTIGASLVKNRNLLSLSLLYGACLSRLTWLFEIDVHDCIPFPRFYLPLPNQCFSPGAN